jgi:hypothetical protein
MVSRARLGLETRTRKVVATALDKLTARSFLDLWEIGGGDSEGSRTRL